MAKKIVAALFFLLFSLVLFAPGAHARADDGYGLGVSALSVNVGETVQFRLKTPSGAAKAALYMNGKLQKINDAPQTADGENWFDFALPVQTSGTKRIRFYVYGENSKLLLKYPNKAVAVKAEWPLYAPVSTDISFLESDMAVLAAQLAPGYTYRQYGFRDRHLPAGARAEQQGGGAGLGQLDRNRLWTGVGPPFPSDPWVAPLLRYRPSATCRLRWGHTALAGTGPPAKLI